jgi:hypothetical protein
MIGSRSLRLAGRQGPLIFCGMRLGTVDRNFKEPKRSNHPFEDDAAFVHCSAFGKLDPIHKQADASSAGFFSWNREAHANLFVFDIHLQRGEDGNLETVTADRRISVYLLELSIHWTSIADSVIGKGRLFLGRRPFEVVRPKAYSQQWLFGGRDFV